LGQGRRSVEAGLEVLSALERRERSLGFAEL
jgi:hypothetical protein